MSSPALWQNLLHRDVVVRAWKVFINNNNYKARCSVIKTINNKKIMKKKKLQRTRSPSPLGLFFMAK
ncbi:hypothetical protein [Acinetobacter nosocomialis]|uniref:hypothetical protein n=1 Tax=Acinetobacter nosocomialis TaxID=106654 RepID=UPI0003661EB5|nr:hypothetical protein FSC12_06025 [Acinetobacter schindleri]